MTGALNVALIAAHTAVVGACFVLAIVSRDPTVLAVLLAVALAVLTQWLILGHCFLNRFESGRDDTDQSRCQSVIIETLAAWVGISYENMDNVLIIAVVFLPSLWMVYKLRSAAVASKRFTA